MTTRFSVITITYNNRDGLKKTASSVLTQTCQDFEWIMIDGASTDGTQSDFTTYPTATIISEPDNGIYDAMNKGIMTAKGDYIIFMNAGDQFASSETLQSVEQKIQNKSIDLIYGDALEESQTGKCYSKKSKSHHKIAWGLFTHHQAIFYNRKTLGDMRYDTSYKIAADYALTLDFLRQEKRCYYIPEPICIFEGGGLSQQHIKLGRIEQFTARRRAGINIAINIWITQMQKAANTIRALSPNLYWTLKSLYKYFSTKG
ncbi:MAG: glycosyltransferase [Alphaproteobacteria bacterium]|nr:glycosyltransferase [Alphaproteobacteria bacterium]MCB9985338.1 glycosyltransferase [Micavibrio sp.]